MITNHQPSARDVHLSRLLVQCTDGRIETLAGIGSGQNINEHLGMIIHGWERTSDREAVQREVITDTGMLVRGDEIVYEDGVSATVTFPEQIANDEDIVHVTEDDPGVGLLRRGRLSSRRTQYLIDNSSRVAHQLNRIFRQVLMEVWIGWYSGEGWPCGLDGTYELDFANDANPEMCDAVLQDHKKRIVDQTRLASDQAEVILDLVPQTVEVEVDVFAEGKRIL